MMGSGDFRREVDRVKWHLDLALKYYYLYGNEEEARAAVKSAGSLIEHEVLKEALRAAA
jgi:hypothetical protein